MNLRPYQLSTLDKIRAAWKEFKKILVVWPTGSGKTVLAANVAKEEIASGGRVLFLAHRQELLIQTLDKFNRACGIIADLEKAEFRASLMAKAVVGSIQTFCSRADKWPADHFSLIIVDECHHIVSDSYARILARFEGCKVMGITASPDRSDKKELGDFFETVADEVGLFDLIRAGFLCPISVKSIPIRISLSGVKQTAGDYDSTELGHAIEPYLDSIADALVTDAAGRKTLVFLPLIATSKKFADICQARGLRAAHIDGTSEDRKELLARFASGDFDVLCNAMLLTEGYDEPSISCILNLRPTRSRPLFSQIIGRGTRICEGKSNLLLLDPLFLHERLKIVVPANLIAKSDEEAEQITELLRQAEEAGGQGKDLEEAAGEATAAREQSLRDRLKAMENRKATLLTPEQFAMRYNRLDVAEYQPTMKWEESPMTSKQAEWIEKAGINVDEVQGKGQASKLLDVYFGELNKQPATNGQRYMMRKANWVSKDGLRNPSTATRGDAREFFAAQNKEKAA